MAEIIDLSDVREFKLRQLEQILKEEMTHPDVDVLALWKSLATESLRKYPGAPSPTNNKLSIELSGNVSKADIEAISVALRAFLSEYQNDVQKIMLNMLHDIILLQREVAEIRAK